MLEDIAYVEKYFEIEQLMLDAEGIAETKRELMSNHWWANATLEEVFDMLFVQKAS
jgi:hypothetical protein